MNPTGYAERQEFTCLLARNLLKKGKVKELFLRQVKTAPVPDAAELQAAAETSTDAVLERALKRKEQQEFEVQLTPQGKVDRRCLIGSYLNLAA